MFPRVVHVRVRAMSRDLKFYNSAHTRAGPTPQPPSIPLPEPLAPHEVTEIEEASGCIAKRDWGKIGRERQKLSVTASDHAGGGGGAYVWERKHAGDAPFRVEFELALKDASVHDITSSAKKKLRVEVAQYLGGCDPFLASWLCDV